MTLGPILQPILQPVLMSALGQGVGAPDYRIGLGRNNVFGTFTNSGAGPDTGTTAKHYTIKGAATALQLIMTNLSSTVGGNGTVETAAPNAVATVKATLEYPLGTTLNSLTVAGVSSWSLAAANAPVVSDTLDVPIADGGAARVRYYAAVGAGEIMKFNSMIGLATESSNHSTQFGDGTDKTGVTGTFAITGPNGIFAYAPPLLVGHVEGGECFLFEGDSIGAGRGFNGNTVWQPPLKNLWDAGFATGRINSINASLSGATDIVMVSGTASVDAKVRLALWSYATRIIDELGINDIASDTVWTQLAARKLQRGAQAHARGKKYYVTTLTPRVTSTDNCITIANQTKSAHETKRTTYNDWVRGGCQVDGSGNPVVSGGTPSPNIDGFIDFASKVEVDATNALTVNGGLWKVPAAALSGPHTLTGTPTTTSFSVGTTPWTANNEVSRVVKMLTGARAGQVAVISGNTTNGLTLYTNGNTTQSGAAVTGLSGAPAAADTFEIWDVKTNEGLHPATAGHADCSGAVDPWLTALGL
jgi:hypothetical protein